ncbi:MAG TPA: hypothetical protein VJH65_01300 [Candidatus Nanoarchaeia archaeon]|nr:hypothetical protein [Candidatus Nanoarchaeia archaeon]
MLQQFAKKPLTARLKDTGYLLKHSFTVIGKDEDIKKPTIRMAVYSSIVTTLIFLSLFFLFSQTLQFLGVILLIFTILFLIPFGFFYYTRQKANQSWIVYNTITGKDISYSDAHLHTKTQKSKLRLIAFISLLMFLAKSRKREKNGIRAVIINLFLRFLEEVWDLLENYMVPSIVIEQKSIKETVPKLKSLKENIPATLVGVFGIDFAGKILTLLISWIYLLAFLISLGIGYLVALITDATVITMGGFSFSWVPVILMLYIVVLIGGIYKKVIESIKIIYFTIFYTSINRPKEIVSSMRGELTNYLLMKE